MANWIVFEGPDRCGKSTQMDMANEWLLSQGIPTFICRDPSKDVALEIRELMLNISHYHESTYLLLYMAARSELYNKQILPNLEKPGVILCDRYRLSTLAYQPSFDQATQDQLHKLAGIGRDPDSYLVYLPRIRWNAPIENWRDSISDEDHFKIVRCYESLAKSSDLPIRAYTFEQETPEDIFEAFTKPTLKSLMA